MSAATQPGPGRRAQQKAAREGRILRAAEALFERHGYAGTALEDIARRARLAVGTIYNYFPAKPAIAIALLRRESETTLAKGEAVLRGRLREPVRAVTALFDVYVDLLVDHDRALVRELLAAGLARPDAFGEAVFELDLRLLAQLHALLARLAEQQRLAPDTDLGRATTTLYSVYLSWLVVYTSSDALAPRKLRSEVAAGVALVMRGLLPR